MRLPVFWFDITEHSEWDKRFSMEGVASKAMEAADYYTGPDKDEAERFLAELIDESKYADDDVVERLATLVADHTESDEEIEALFDVDEIRRAWRDSVVWAYERCLTPDEERIESAIREAAEGLIGEEMHGILTQTYWCGVLASWPWAELGVEEEHVTADALRRCTVKGGKIRFTYGGSKYSRRLIRLAKAENSDSGFGGNSDMEFGTIARCVFESAIKQLDTERWDRAEHHAYPSSEDIRSHLQEALR